MKLGRLESQICPQCAPPSPRPSERVRVDQHVVDHVEVAVDVAGDREEQHARAVLAGQVVVAELRRGLVGARRHRRDALLVRRLVVRRIAEHVHAVPAGRDGPLAAAAGSPAASRMAARQDRLAHRGIAQPGQPVGDREPRQRGEGRAGGERVERGGQAQDDADWPAGDLRGERGAARAGACARRPSAGASAAGRRTGRSAGTTPAGRSRGQAWSSSRIRRLRRRSRSACRRRRVPVRAQRARRCRAVPVSRRSGRGPVRRLVVLCCSVREVVKPKAPARRASTVRRDIAAMSSAVAASRRTARSPMT